MPQQIFAYLHRALHVLLHFRANEYSHVLCLHLLTLNYWRRHQHPAWRAFCHDPRIFSEERCEANLSTVARHSLTDPMRFDVQHVEQTLLLVTHSRCHVAPPSESQGQKIEPRGDEVEIAYNFLSNLIEDIVHDRARMYPTGAALDWDSKEDMKQRLVPFDLKLEVMNDVLPKFTQNVDRCRRLTVLDWLVTVRAAIEHGIVDDPDESVDLARAESGLTNASRSSSSMSSGDDPPDGKSRSSQNRILPRPRRRRRRGEAAASDGEEMDGMAQSEAADTSDSSDSDSSQWSESASTAAGDSVQQSLRPPERRAARAARASTWQLRFSEDIQSGASSSSQQGTM